MTAHQKSDYSVTAKPAGWLYKIIVDKHLTGPPREGQTQIAGVWGTPSTHLHFSVDKPTDPWVYWQAPVYYGQPHVENPNGVNGDGAKTTPEIRIARK